MISNNMVIDAFPGFNEIELAAFRINYLSESVDLVVIAEAKLTHSGIEKPLYFKNWIRDQSSDSIPCEQSLVACFPSNPDLFATKKNEHQGHPQFLESL